MDDLLWVYDELSILGPDEVEAWRDVSNANRLCGRCQSIDWGPAILYLSITDEYNLYPKAQLYGEQPQLQDIRDAAHVGCHLCTVILTCLLTLRYGYSANVHPIPVGMDEITDSRAINVDIEGMPGINPVWLNVTIADHSRFSDWRSISLPIKATLRDVDNELTCIDLVDQIARNWLDDCLQDHKVCHTETSQLSRGIINVSQDPLRLEEPGPKRSPYAALSYTIGGAHLFTTTSANLSDRKSGFPVASLPLTVRDAVWWTRHLHLSYLWLDSLCILQGNLRDWETELGTMAAIYRDATVMLAAAPPATNFPCSRATQSPASSSFRTTNARTGSFSKAPWTRARGVSQKSSWRAGSSALAARNWPGSAAPANGSSPRPPPRRSSCGTRSSSGSLGAA